MVKGNIFISCNYTIPQQYIVQSAMAQDVSTNALRRNRMHNDILDFFYFFP